MDLNNHRVKRVRYKMKPIVMPFKKFKIGAQNSRTHFRRMHTNKKNHFKRISMVSSRIGGRCRNTEQERREKCERITSGWVLVLRNLPVENLWVRIPNPTQGCAGKGLRNDSPREKYWFLVIAISKVKILPWVISSFLHDVLKAVWEMHSPCSQSAPRSF